MVVLQLPATQSSAPSSIQTLTFFDTRLPPKRALFHQVTGVSPYSGTRAEASFAESAGLVGTELTARIVATRLPGNPPLEATFSVAGTEKTLRDQDGTLVGSIRFTVPEGAWTVTVDSPRGGGPHLLLASLTLSDGHQRTDLLMEGN